MTAVKVPLPLIGIGSRTTVHKDPTRPVRPWTVTYGCGCDPSHSTFHKVALTLATHHHCPPTHKLPDGVRVPGVRTRKAHR